MELRYLTDDPWNGGCGISLEQVGEMTLDQIYFRVCDKKLFGKEGERSQSVNPHELAAESDGTIRGRAADGTPIKGKIRGKSLARQLMEEQQKIEEQKKRQEERKKRRDRRRLRLSSKEEREMNRNQGNADGS